MASRNPAFWPLLGAGAAASSFSVDAAGSTAYTGAEAGAVAADTDASVYSMCADTDTAAARAGGGGGALVGRDVWVCRAVERDKSE